MNTSASLRLVVLAAGFVAAMLPATLQAEKPPLRCVGIMYSGVDPADKLIPAFIDGMRENGFVERSNVCYDLRRDEAVPARMEQNARELVAAKVALIFVTSTPRALAAQKATSTIPIVFALVGDPVASGLTRSLSKPGGNITGFSLLNPGLRAKRVEILHDIAPSLKRIGVLYSPLQTKIYESALADVEKGAAIYGKDLLFVPANTSHEFEEAFSKLEKWRPQAFMMLESSLFYAHRKALLQRATKNGWPTVAGDRQYAEVGALVSYGADYVDISRRSASYVARILKGAKPADLPVQQPVKFELVINMKAAKALRLTVPQRVRVLADHVIE